MMFETADVLDADLISRIEPADIVVAQNFLYHFDRRQARTAFAHLCSSLRPRVALFDDRMDIDLRHSLSRKAGLLPLDCLIPEIHDDAMTLRGVPSPWTYWGLEPLNSARKDWKQGMPRSFSTTRHRLPRRAGNDRLIAPQVRPASMSPCAANRRAPAPFRRSGRA